MLPGVHAAAPRPPDVKQAVIDWWEPILADCYGATEGPNTYVRDRFAHYKALRTLDFVDELPRLATWNLAERKLQERYSEAH